MHVQEGVVDGGSTCSPWKWRFVSSARSFVKPRRKVSPARTRITGPG